MRDNLIVCVVEEGKADSIVKAALDAGVQGATILHARGTGALKSFGYLAMSIKPEKEMVLIATKGDQTEKIFDLIVKQGHLDRPGAGFAFVQRIEKSVGFPEDIDLEAARKEMEKGAII